MDARIYFDQLQSRALSVVVDDPGLVGLAEGHGHALALDAYDLLTPHARAALILSARWSTVEALYDSWEDAPGLFTHLSLARYDASEAACRYALGRIAQLDVRAALARRAARYTWLQAHDSAQIETKDARLDLRLAAELEVANTSEQLRSRWLQALTEFLEASLVNIESPRSSFVLDGRFAFEGLSHLTNTAEVRAALEPELRALQVAAAAPGAVNLLELRDNALVGVTIAGEDRTERVAALFAEDPRGAKALEFGLGCATFEPDWRVNSPLHKCCLGVFVGLGTGHRGPHIDFVSTGAQLHPDLVGDAA